MNNTHRQANSPCPRTDTPPSALRSSLAGIQLDKPMTREELRRLAAKVWRERGLALIDPVMVENDFARQTLINEATFLYGRKNAP